MNLSPTSKAGLTVVLGIGVMVWLITMFVFFSYSGEASRGGRFYFALAQISFLEWLAVGYLAVPFIPAVRRKSVAALYPVFGIVLGGYVLRALFMPLLTHTLPFMDSLRTQLLTVGLGLVPFLALMGAIFVLNVWQSGQSDAIRAERADLLTLAARVTKIHHHFTDAHRKMDTASFARAESLLRKLKERFSFCTPFHRQPPAVPDIGRQIEQRIDSLEEAVHSAAENQTASDIVEHAASELLGLMERREKLLVK